MVRRTAPLVALVLIACGRDEPASQPSSSAPAPLRLESIELEVRPGAASPRLTTGPDGLALSWIEPDGEDLRLQLQPWKGTTQTVVKSERLLQNWADLPSVLPVSGGWIAAWPQRREEDGYDLRWARGQADGSWAARGPVSDALEGPEFGFVSFAVGDSGTVSAFWLDGRASTTSHGGAMQLWTATIGPDGIENRRVVDDRVCDCCQTDAASTPRGPVVVYRDRSEDEVRDVWLAGPSPEQRRRLGRDEWRIEGCPVNGPSVVASGETLAVAWYSAASSPGHVRVAFAQGDAAFGDPIDVGDGAPLGRVDVAWLSEDAVAVLWLERTDAGAEIRLRRVTKDGTRSSSTTLAKTDASRSAGFPQLERYGDALAFAWVVVADGPSSIHAGHAPVATVMDALR